MYHLFLQLLFCDDHFPLPFALPAGEEKAASHGQGCAIAVQVEEGVWKLPPSSSSDLC